MKLCKAKGIINNQNFENQKKIEKNEKEKEESQNIINNRNKIKEKENPQKVDIQKTEKNFLYKNKKLN